MWWLRQPNASARVKAASRGINDRADILAGPAGSSQRIKYRNIVASWLSARTDGPEGPNRAAGIDFSRLKFRYRISVATSRSPENEMTPSCLPLISETDYSGFQRMIKELMHVSYREWQQDHHKAVSYRQSRNGSREVAITPAEFDSWLKKNRLDAHLELLWSCVEEMADSSSDRAPAAS
jgi:hypothetical protein